MAESGLIVCVPEADSAVAGLRQRFDASARLGVPAHITVLYPFMAPTELSASVVQALQSALAGVASFRFSLSKVGRFPTAAYLEPEPAEPFAALTERMFRAFPGFPPYGGAYPTVVPHLTVAQASAQDAATAQAELESALQARGPIHAHCTAVWLIENSSGRWQRFGRFPLADSASASAAATGHPS